MVLDEHGKRSNVAEITITSDCFCKPYVSKKSSSVSALEDIGVILLILVQMLASLYLFRREELELR
jgi:hypothetical protein